MMGEFIEHEERKRVGKSLGRCHQCLGEKDLVGCKAAKSNFRHKALVLNAWCFQHVMDISTTTRKCKNVQELSGNSSIAGKMRLPYYACIQHWLEILLMVSFYQPPVVRRDVCSVLWPWPTPSGVKPATTNNIWMWSFIFEVNSQQTVLKKLALSYHNLAIFSTAVSVCTPHPPGFFPESMCWQLIPQVHQCVANAH